MSEVETHTYPLETLREFSAAVFRHFGVPEEDAALASEVLAKSDLRGIEASEMESHFGVEASQLLNYSEEVETRQQQKALRRDRELWKYCLAAAIALLFLETALAQFVGRRAG